MMNNQNKKKINTVLILVFITISGYCQQNFHIVIQFFPPLDTNDISIIIHNGRSGRYVPLNRDGRLDIIEPVYSKYATLYIASEHTGKQENFIITTNKSTIKFQTTKDTSNINYPFGALKATNVIEFSKCKEIEDIKGYTKKEVQEKEEFEQKYRDDLMTNDSLKKIYKQISKTIIKKQLEFIKLHSDNYIYLWWFNLVIKGRPDIEPESLLAFFKSVLYPKYKHLSETDWILNYLQIRSMSINNPAPDFVARDITGKEVSLKQLKGKFVLLNFWATWCVPCVAELPLIKKLREEIPEDKLVIVSISEDENMSDLENGIKKYGLNWSNICCNDDILNKYNFANGIPKTVLIDKEGRLVFKQLGPLNSIEELKALILYTKSSQ
jgi:thiol-disulfide isomerase/thioredoxin